MYREFSYYRKGCSNCGGFGTLFSGASRTFFKLLKYQVGYPCLRAEQERGVSFSDVDFNSSNRGSCSCWPNQRGGSNTKLHFNSSSCWLVYGWFMGILKDQEYSGRKTGDQVIKSSIVYTLFQLSMFIWRWSEERGYICFLYNMKTISVLFWCFVCKLPN